MNTADQINSVIDKLAEKLGTTVDKVYPMFIRQATIDGLIDLFLTIFGIILIIYTLTYLHKTFMVYDKDGYNAYRIAYRDDRENGVQIKIGILSGLSILFFIVVLVIFSDMITALSNPQYYAFTKILSFIARATN